MYEDEEVGRYEGFVGVVGDVYGREEGDREGRGGDVYDCVDEG